MSQFYEPIYLPDSRVLPKDLVVHPSVYVATTGNITLSGQQTVDGTLVPNGRRVLVKDQTDAVDNGIWITNDSGAWSRAPDMANGTQISLAGVYVFVDAGSTQAQTLWMVSGGGGGGGIAIVVGDTTINWAQVGSGGDASVHAGPEAPTDTDAERPHGALWIDTDEVTGDLMGVPVASAKMWGGTTSVPSSQSTQLTNFTNQSGETSWCDPVAGTITVPEDGLYLVGGNFKFPESGTGTRVIANFLADGVGIPGGTDERYAAGGTQNDPGPNWSTVAELTAGQVISATAYHTFGSLLATSGDVQALTVTKFTGAPVVLDNRYAKSSDVPFKPSVLGAGAVGTLQNGWEDYNAISVTHTLHFSKVGRLAFAQGLFRHTSVPANTSVMLALNPNWLPYASRQIIVPVKTNTGFAEVRVTATGIELWTGHGLTGSVWVSVSGLQWLTASEDL